MKVRVRRIVPFLLAGTLAVLPGWHPAQAASPAAGSLIRDARLGVALAPPAGWTRLPRVPASEIDFAHLHAGSVEGYIRLVIRVFARTDSSSPAQAARMAARVLAAQEGQPFLPSTRRIAGQPAILLRNLPGDRPAIDMLVAYDRAVYLLILPGKSIAADQRRALASLRFTTRRGVLPLQPQLTVQPLSPIIGRPIRVTLLGARPHTVYHFTATPHHAGFGGGNLGSRHANAIGAVTFQYPAFTNPKAAGLWTFAAYGPHGRAAKVTVSVSDR